MDEREFSEKIDMPEYVASSQNDLMENVNETYEKMLKDVRKMIEDNNEAVMRDN